MQRNWIGRSEGAEVLFRIDELDVDVPVFTTRPDTLFGATFFVLAPEHPLVEQLAERPETRRGAARTLATRGAKRERGARRAGRRPASSPGATRRTRSTASALPIWVADYVLMDYGTGAIMAVPAHDERDFEFAESSTCRSAGGRAREARSRRAAVRRARRTRCSSTRAVHRLPAPEGERAIVDWLGERGRGKAAINYRLRDWGFSRQRYWGCPIPIVYCEDCGAVPVPEDQLPVLLPDIEDYRPKGIAPLAAAEDWVQTRRARAAAGRARREAETMDTFVDSSWYFLRYCDPHNDAAPLDRAIVD